MEGKGAARDVLLGGHPLHNRLLRHLPPDELARMEPDLQRVTLEDGLTLSESGATLAHVWFPETAVISMVVHAEDGSTVEAATIGNEGLVGLSAYLGVPPPPQRVFTQIPGEAIRMPVPAFREEVSRSGALQAAIGRFIQTLLVQMAQSVACNRLHPVEERCARWLAQTHDRVEGDRFHLTQQFMAEMLGVHRPSVTVAAGLLQRAGFIRYRRGIVEVLDREGLEAAACECYRVIRDEIDRLVEG